MQRWLWQLETGQADHTVPNPLKKKKHTKLLEYTQENKQFFKMMVRINKDSYIIVAIIPFLTFVISIAALIP